jgi:dolichol-phosphate mannosyltransferase
LSSSACRDYLVVIPVLNEAEALPHVLRELFENSIPRERVLVVDGGSTDGSREVAESMGFRVIVQRGRGKALAIKTALEESSSDCYVFMDGDYTYPARHVHELLSLLERGYDLVIGARLHCEKGAQSLIYKIGNRLLTLFFRVLFGVKLSDVLSGMYAARSELLREIGFELSGFSVESEIVAHATTLGYRVTETPITYRRRIGEKKLRVRDGFKIALDMVRLTWRYNPVFLIFALGALMLIPGLYLDAFVLYRWLFHGVVHHVRALAGITLSGLGVLCLLLSLLSLYLKRFEIRVLRAVREIRRTVSQ